MVPQNQLERWGEGEEDKVTALLKKQFNRGFSGK
jgi:hypothetical protein